MRGTLWICGYLCILSPPACGDGGYKCGTEAQYCGGVEEICVCQTRSCAIPTELSDNPSQECAFVYREFPFAAKLLAEDCVDPKHLNSETDQTRHIPAGSRLTCAELATDTDTDTDTTASMADIPAATSDTTTDKTDDG